MRYFDLHCDTLCECYLKKQKMSNNAFHVDLKYKDLFETYVQCCASFIADNIIISEGHSHFLNYYSQLEGYNTFNSTNDLKNVNENGGYLLIPTIENANALGDNIENVYKVYNMGVRMMTLTWNQDNLVGSGILGEKQKGLTKFGIELVSIMDKLGMIIDVSHASPSLFDDVCKYSVKPFAASHSNAKNICSHVRNLSDEQIKEIIKREGIIGINFYTAFLNNNSENANIFDIIKHIEYMLSLGGENVVSMGSDFDGAEIPKDMYGLKSVPNIYNEMLKLNYNEELLDKIFYKNAYDFFIKSLT